MKRGGEFPNRCWQVRDIVCGSSVLCVWLRSVRVLASVHLRAREREKRRRIGDEFDDLRAGDSIRGSVSFFYFFQRCKCVILFLENYLVHGCRYTSYFEQFKY